MGRRNSSKMFLKSDEVFLRSEKLFLKSEILFLKSGFATWTYSLKGKSHLMGPKLYLSADLVFLKSDLPRWTYSCNGILTKSCPNCSSSPGFCISKSEPYTFGGFFHISENLHNALF